RFIEGAYRSLKIPALLIRKIAVTGTPLFINELLWSMGQTFINSNYATRGIVVIAATNISGTAWNLFCVIMFAMGSAVSILVGQRLGAGDTEGAIDVDRKLLFITLVSHVFIGLLIFAAAPFLPMLYNVEPEVRALATKCLVVLGACLPIHSLIHCIYFTVRSGGKTLITFLFDSVYTWVVPAMLSFTLCRLTTLPILTVYLIVQFSDIIKLCIGIPMVKSGFWTKCVISDVGENGEG
ncbi:MAG: MATE family efflux transporter, partial [Eubacteriales bacterium]